MKMRKLPVITFFLMVSFTLPTKAMSTNRRDVFPKTRSQLLLDLLVRYVEGSRSIDDSIRFTKDHMWIRTSNNIGTVGTAQKLLEIVGELVYIELPEVGDELEIDEAFGSMEGVVGASDLSSPVTGQVVEINSELESNPGLVNKDNYAAGWMIKVKVTNHNELDQLMTQEEYDDFLVKTKDD